MSETMSEQRTNKTLQERPAPDGYLSWPEYWTAKDMPWRIEPEIDETQQTMLRERLSREADVAMGIYPFQGVRLQRGDIEWLLANARTTPIAASDPSPLLKELLDPTSKRHPGKHARDDYSEGRAQLRALGSGQEARPQGLDLRGANLQRANLSGLPLTGMIGGLDWIYRPGKSLMQSDEAAVHLEGAELAEADFRHAVLGGAHLEGSDLFDADFTGAMLYRAHLNGVDARQARFDGANLRLATMDATTELAGASFGISAQNGVTLVDVRWGGANLSNIDWSSMTRLGDEASARLPRRRGDTVAIESQTIEFERAARAYRQLAAVLRAQGVVDHADRFSLLAQHCQRRVFRRRHSLGKYLGSSLLNLISGYGYKPLRSLYTYVITISIFAVLFWCVTNNVPLTFGWFAQIITWLGMAPPPQSPQHLQGYEAVVMSITSFHGRGFFQPTQSPGDRVAILAAIEAVFGLLLEIVLIATFTQRFFAR